MDSYTCIESLKITLQTMFWFFTFCQCCIEEFLVVYYCSSGFGHHQCLHYHFYCLGAKKVVDFLGIMYGEKVLLANFVYMLSTCEVVVHDHPLVLATLVLMMLLFPNLILISSAISSCIVPNNRNSVISPLNFKRLVHIYVHMSAMQF